MEPVNYLSEAKAVSMGDEWYGLNERNHFWMQWRFKVISTHLKPFISKKCRILEIGCGNGVVINQFHDELGLVIDGCDLNLSAFKDFKQVPGKVFLYNIYDLHPDLTGKYDVLLLLDVIEHIEDDKNFLETAMKHLKDDGLVVINVPANEYLFSAYDIKCGHKRRYSRKELSGLLTNLHLEISVSQYWGFFLLPLLVIRKIFLSVYKGDEIRKGFKPPNVFFNRMMLMLMKFETSMVPSLFPGTSVIAIARKTKH